MCPPPHINPPHREHSPFVFLKDTFVWGEGVSEHRWAQGRTDTRAYQFHRQNNRFSHSPLEAPTQNWPQCLSWGMGRPRGEEKVDRQESRDWNRKTDTHRLKYPEAGAATRMAPFNDTYTQTHTMSTHPQRHIDTLTSKDTHRSGPLHQHTSRACTSPGKGFLIWTKWPEFVSESGWVEL